MPCNLYALPRLWPLAVAGHVFVTILLHLPGYWGMARGAMALP